jgi:transposase
MNSEEIFRLALNIQSPWYIKEIRLEKHEGEFIGKMEIHIDFKKGEKFTLPDGSQCTAYDTETRRWQHLNFFQHECFIIARVPRVAGEDGKPRTISVPWARSGSGFTLLFEAYTMLLIEHEMPMNKVAKTIRITAPRVWRIFNHWINLAVQKDDVSQVKQLGIDETSAKKGHDYVTVGIDLERRRVIHVGKGKDVESIGASLNHVGSS